MQTFAWRKLKIYQVYRPYRQKAWVEGPRFS